MPREHLRIATRSSAQATTQAQVVATALRAAHPGLSTELVFVDTLGDRRQDVALHTIGGQGVFVKEVQRCVLAGDADIAVHSAKDLPSEGAEGLTIGAFSERRDPRDALVGSTLGQLRPGATVATGAVRRRAQLRAIRPDLRFVELRGNIQTRLSKVPPDGAIVMAVAALEVLGITDRIAETMAADVMVPAVGQGCVALEHRSDDLETAALVALVDHGPTRRAVVAERAFLAELGSGCSLPIGAHVTTAADAARIAAFMADEHDRVVQVSVVLGADWSASAAEVARTLRAEIEQ